MSFLASCGENKVPVITIINVKSDDGAMCNEFVRGKSQTAGHTACRLLVSAKVKKTLEAYLKVMRLRYQWDVFSQSENGQAFSAHTMTQLFLNI